MTPQPATNSRGRRLWSAAKIALALGLIAYIASRTDLGEIAALRQRLSVPWLAASVMIFAMLNGVRAYQYYLLIGRRAEFGRVLNLVILQNTLSNFVASSAGALAYVAMLSAGEGVTVRRAAASFVIAKLGDLVAVGALLAVSAALVWARIAALHGLVMLLLASVVAITGVILLAALMHGALIGTIERWLGRLGVHEHPASARMLQMLRSVTEEAPGELRAALSAALLYSTIGMLLNLAWLYACLRAFSLEIPVAAAALMNALLQLLSWIPIQVFGGLGVVEAALVYLATFFGVAQSTMAPVSIGIRVALYVTSCLVLAYPLLSELRSRAERT